MITRRRFCILALSCLLMPVAAQAVYIASPGFPTIDPGLAADHYFVRTQYSIQNSLSTDGSNGNSGSQTFAADVSTPVTQPILAVQGSGDLGAAFGHEQDIASGTVFGSAAFGTLKVYSQSYAHAGVARNDSSMTIDLIDKMTITHGGKPEIGVDITGLPTRQYQDSNNYANAWGSVDIYLWPTSRGVPLPGQLFQPAYHTHDQINWDGTTSYVESDPSATFDAGTTWYYAARVSANSVANIGDGPYWISPVYPDFQAVGDFSHSFALRIGADASTPDFSYAMASGINYATPVPEPAGLAVALPMVVLLVLRRRRK